MDLLEKIKNITEIEYWKLIENDLKEFPIKVDHIVSILNEIKDIIYQLIPKRINKLINLEKNVDTKNIKKNNDSFYLLEQILFLLEQLKTLESPDKDEKTNENIKILKKI